MMCAAASVLRSSIVVAILSAGCAPVATVEADGTVTHHYLGYVKVQIPASYSTGQSPHAVKVESLGLQVRDGIGLGYVSDSRVVVPLDCRLVVLVQNQDQLDRAVESINKASREGLCVSVYAD